MVEQLEPAVHPEPVDDVGAHPPADGPGGLERHDVDARVLQPVGAGQAGEARADDRDVGAGGRCRHRRDGTDRHRPRQPVGRPAGRPAVRGYGGPVTATAARLHLRRPPAGFAPPAGEFGPLGPPEQLAPLMLAAYRGTPDDEGESLQDAVEVLADAMRGGFGPWLPDASFVALEDGEPVGAALTALADDEPFVAFLFTVPDAVGRGVATRLVGRVCQALAADGYDSVALWVGVANERAARLYRHMGFVDVP